MKYKIGDIVLMRDKNNGGTFRVWTKSEEDINFIEDIVENNDCEVIDVYKVEDL